MFELIVLIGIVYWIGTKWGDHAGTIALAVLIVFLLILFISGWRKDSRAYGNRIDYWSKSGKDRARARRQWEREAREEEERERTRQWERAQDRRVREAQRRARKEQKRMKRVLREGGREVLETLEKERDFSEYRTPAARWTVGDENEGSVSMPVRPVYVDSTHAQTGRLFVCHTCGSVIRTKGDRKELWDGRVVTSFYCPKCRMIRWTQI